ncbi:N-acetyltransferase [Frondihabitans sucicola]|uniref:N-acetyltransferase n=1 Tax=Frondihabitans sucicola TaxID=1268041 RepID=A0ABN6Y1W9_9MICO|nr:GNAT family N-acetyltransferase [Frondihabitans sucicola]BDZ49718.1 N-acetyltransferase [Frondihabitans sucicola]
MTSQVVAVRDAVVDDATGIARVHVDSWRETYAGVLNERFFSEDAFQRRAAFWSTYLQLDPRPGFLAVAETGGRIVGFANSGESIGVDAEHGFPAARPITLFSIYLLAQQQGTGAGQALHDSVIGGRPAQLWVLQGNDRATAFYERNGFAFDGAEFVDPRDSNLIELRMVR